VSNTRINTHDLTYVRALTLSARTTMKNSDIRITVNWANKVPQVHRTKCSRQGNRGIIYVLRENAIFSDVQHGENSQY
jgi:hypothetical protein